MKSAIDAPAPARPSQVPCDARWSAQVRGWSQGHWDTEDRPDGRHQVYGDAGRLRAALQFLAGSLHGPFVEYHPNGELARRGNYDAGKLDGECVRYASSEPTQEILRPCCVPPGAWSMRSHFAQGRCLFEHFYDRQEQRLLDDGSAFPALPANVPTTVHFDSKTRRWWLVEFDAQGERHGTSSTWLEGGELDERSEYVKGQRDGVWEKFALGRLLRRHEYRAGVADGPCFESSPEYEDPRIVQRRGQYARGRHAGLWRFEDEQGNALVEFDFGVPCQQLDPFALRDDVPETESLGRALLVQLIRWGLGTLQPAHAEDATAQAALRLTQLAPRLKPNSSDALLRSVRNEDVGLEARLAALLDALTFGATPTTILRELGTHFVHSPWAGLGLSSLATALAPERMDALGARALLALEVGFPELAQRDIATLHASVPEVAVQVQFSWLTRYEAFDFTPLAAQLDDLATDELPSEVTQPLSKVRTCVAQLALRLNTLRAAIIEARSALDRQLGAGTVLAATSALLPAWIPPDLSALVSEEPCSLQDYTFVSEAEGESDTIAVSERLELGGLHLCALVERARLDWIALCWLCWGAGLDRVELPPQLVPRAAYGRALATAFQRVWRSRDRLQSLGLLARKQGVPSFTWHGAAVETLSPQWARAARDQYLEMRAALYFLGDETCRSLWQDDLRV